MPHVSRIAPEALLLRENGSGLVLRAQGAGMGDAATGVRPVPPGTERVEDAFGVLGMTISGLIIVCAAVLLVMKARRNR